MYKKFISVLLAAIMLLTITPVFATEDAGNVLFSEGFSSYAENETVLKSVTVSGGLDTRVVSDNGNKVLFSRAAGDGVKVKIPVSEIKGDTTVFSYKVKITGNKTTGKLLTFILGSSKFDLLTLGEDGCIKLSDRKIVGGIPFNNYYTYSVVMNWEAGTYDVYVNDRCAVKSWDIPASVNKAILKEINISLDFEGKESDLYIDDIRVYNGEQLPWERSFPSESSNTTVLDFTPTTEISNAVKLYKSVEFNGNTAGVSINVAGAKVLPAEDEDGTRYAHLFADEKTSSWTFFDAGAAELADVNKYVLEIKFRVNEFKSNAKLAFFDARASNGNWRRGFVAQSDGSIISYDGSSKKTTFTEGEWIRFSACYNISAGKADLYKDGIYLSTMSVSDLLNPTTFRVDVTNPIGGVHNSDIDYIRIYSGSQPVEESYFEGGGEGGRAEVSFDNTRTIMDPADKLSAALLGTTVLMTSNDNIYLNGEKTTYPDSSYKAVEIDGKPMIPVKLIDAIAGGEAAYNSTENVVTYKGKNITISQSAHLSNGTWYLPLECVAKDVLGRKFTWDDRGCAIIADREFPVQRDHFVDRYIMWHDADLIYRFMQFENPSGYKMIDDLKSNLPGNVHPRLLYTKPQIEFILNKIDTDDDFKKAYNDLIAKADLELSLENKSLYEGAPSKQTASSTLQSSMGTLARAYLLTGNSKYAVKGIEIMDAMIKWQELTNDLYAGHWMTTIAMGYDSFYNYMKSIKDGQQIINKFNKAIYSMVIAAHIDAYQGNTSKLDHMKIQDNFAGVGVGGLMSILVAVADEKEFEGEVAYLLENAMKTMEVFACLFYPNGGYYESVGYSTYGLGTFTTALVGMKNSFGGFYGLEKAKGFAEYGYSLTFLQSTDWNVCYHDGSTGYVETNLAETFSYLFDDPNQAALAQRQKNLMNRSKDISELFFYTMATEGKEDRINLDALGTDRYFYGAEAGGFSSDMNVADPTFVGIHGGLTNIPHDMLDLGQFFFESDNVKWATDLGSDDYNITGYFEEGGYRLYRKRPEGENCIVLNPQVDPEGYYGQNLGARAELIMLDMNKPKGAMAAYDLTSAYARDANKYVRGYYFGDDRNSLIVQDELSLKGNTEFYWFMQTGAEIEILSNNQARLKSSSGKTLLVDVYCSDPNYTLKAMDAVPLPSSPQVEGQKTNTGYRKLAIHAPAFSGNVTVSVKLSPENGKYDYTPLSVTPINTWSIPEGEKTPTPRLLAVYCDGVDMKQTGNGLSEYTLTLPYGTQNVPLITAVSDIGNIEITQPASLYDSAKFKISGEGMRTVEIVANLSVSMHKPIVVTDELHNIKPVPETPAKLIVPLAAAGEDENDKGNKADHLLDNDLSTRCAMEGRDIWFEVDYGQVYDVKGVALGFNVRAQR